MSEQWIRYFRKVNLYLGQISQNARQILKHLLVETGMEKELKEHEHIRRKNCSKYSPLFLFLSIFLLSKTKVSSFMFIINTLTFCRNVKSIVWRGHLRSLLLEQTSLLTIFSTTKVLNSQFFKICTLRAFFQKLFYSQSAGSSNNFYSDNKYIHQ